MKILICDGMHESGLALLQAAEGIQVDAPDQLSAEEIKARLHEYDAMVVRSRTKVTADMLENASRLKVIGRAGTGVDNIDVHAAIARGILVMNTPGANAMAAAEHTLALMFALARHIPQANQSMREGRWEKKRFMGTELYHQTLGIIGLGKIGSIVADRAIGLKMDVLGYDPHILPEAAAILGVEWVPLDELLARSDFLTLHTPSTSETRYIINRHTLAKAKPGIRILNCARGDLIDEEALYDALMSGHVAGAALDVFNQEPPTGNPLLQLPNVISTPHLGASSFQAQANVARAIASQILDFLQLGIIRNAVNFPSISPKDYERIRPYLLLAEKLGSLQGQIVSPIQRLEIEYSGPELQEVPLEPLTQSVIKGLLDPILAEKVNLVNAHLLLKERQIELVAATASESRGYTGKITVKVKGKQGDSSAAGTVFAKEEIRLVRFNNYRLEAELEGINLLIQNLDKPGTIGFIGTTLGNYQVNIANMHLSRTPERGTAIAIIRIDEEAPEEALYTLRSHPNILSVQQVKL
ncbi:MAG: phosphoglycerate dehydrogenase [Deltaproteobacteria bacterium]|jgi:D-3-phosphoglycerate dehydrogenase|nr:phosphoglycerate dehydrogenase [Deltaproteobacteria bacterium]